MSKRKSTRPPKGGANPERARAEAERRRSNAAGTHPDRRTKRRRSRKAAHSLLS